MNRMAIASNLYQSLLHSITSTLKAGFLAAQKLLEYQRLKTYWDIGRQINIFTSASDGEIKITEKLYQNISGDIEAQMGLQLTPDTIGRMVQFHHLYPQFPKKTTLTFTHYLALMRVADEKERRRLEQKAIKEEWSSPQMKAAVFKVNALWIPKIENSAKLIVERGEPYVYSVHKYKDITGGEDFYIDCGFKIDVPLNGMVVKSDISSIVDKARGVRVIKKDEKYIVQQHHDAVAKLYTYTATVQKIVDADTIDVRIDVGFSIRLYDRLRFRGINAPEIKTKEGKLAKQFLVDYLSDCPQIIVRTYKQKEEMYGRWLTDIFCLKDCADPYRIAKEGEFLNQRLLDEGLAVIY